MCQERKPEAGKYKHNKAEHPIWIFDRRTCSLVCVVFRCEPKRYLTPQFWHFSFVLDRIVHLPVPSENVSRRGKKISESLPPRTGHDRADGSRRGVLQRKIKKTDPAKESGEIRDKSEETMDATSPGCCALLTLIGRRSPTSYPAQGQATRYGRKVLTTQSRGMDRTASGPRRLGGKLGGTKLRRSQRSLSRRASTTRTTPRVGGMFGLGLTLRVGWYVWAWSYPSGGWLVWAWSYPSDGWLV